MKNKPWGEWRTWQLDEFEGHTVYIVCDNMEALSKMPRGFWKGLYGERVIGIGSVVEKIGEQPCHKGQFMRTVAEDEQEAISTANMNRAKRIIVICPTGGHKWFIGEAADKMVVVTEPQQLAAIVFEEYMKKFPPPFVGKTVFITSGGPTFPWREFRDGLLEGKTVLGVNRIIALCSNFDVYFQGDSRGYWEHGHKQEIDDFKGLKYSCNLKWPRDRSLVGMGRFDGLVRIGTIGLDKRPDRVAWNKSSGGAAIDLAVHLGAKRIVLVGYTMRSVDGAMNWYGEAFADRDHPGLTFMKNKKGMLDGFLRPYPKIAIDAKARGIEIINATEGSAIDCFPFVPLKELL